MSAKTYQEVQDGGDAVVRTGVALMAMEASIAEWQEQDLVLVSFTVRPANEENYECMVIGRFDNGGARLVTFVSGETVAEAVRKFAHNMKVNRLKLREDRYANGQG